MTRQYISLLGHIYQPPTQTKFILNKIYRESYNPLITLLENEPNVFFSIDIAKSLGERLPPEFLERIRTLYKNNRIELVNTFAYHYLGPLTPREFIKRQLQLNEKFYHEHFIGNDAVHGVFPPELAFASGMSSVFKEMHYSWCLADDESFTRMRYRLPGEKQVPYDTVPSVFGKTGGAVLMRSGMRSKEIAFSKYTDGREFADVIINSMQDWGKRLGQGHEEGYIILALDGETFGHHLPGSIEHMLLPFMNRVKERNDEAKIVPIDFIYRHFPKVPMYIPKSSWSTGDSEYPYPLWDHPKNPFHRAWNEFLEIAYASVPVLLDEETERLFDTSFYSCTPWQYSMGNKNVARWCFFSFTKIIEKIPDGFEKTRLKELLEEMDRLTR